MSIAEIIKKVEGRRLEFKESLPKKSNLAKTVISFSNDSGGEIYIGIQNDPRKIIGIPEEELLETEEKISNIIHDNCSPIILPEISFVSFEGKHIIKVKIHRGNNLPYFLKSQGKTNGTYIRVGSSNRLADSSILEELQRQHQNISFDSMVVYDYEINVNDISDFVHFYEEKCGETITSSTLRKLGISNLYKQKDVPTHTYFLVANEEIKRRLFPYAKTECARFKGINSEDFIDQKTFAGSIITQAELAYNFVLRHINQAATVKGIYTNSRWEYPVKAIREVLRNAVVHRDYSMTGKDIKVAIFDDSIEITSPGKLLPSIDFNDFESRQSDIRNKVIAPIFKRCGIIDQWGNGLKLINDELAEYPSIDFKWIDNGIQLQITFKKIDYNSTLTINEGKGIKFDSHFNKLVEEIGTKLGLSWDQVGTKLGLSWYPVIEILNNASSPVSIQDLQNAIQFTNRSKFRKKYINLFIELGLLAMTIPHKPTSPKQKYYLTKMGISFVENIEEISTNI
jgi:predicted HTH transcriptional regulator